MTGVIIITKVYLTRHGETIWNTIGRMQGWSDSPLTDLGIKQANWLKDRIEHVNIDIIYTSPLKRAKHTAEILIGNRNIEIKEHEGLKEIRLGQWQGLDQEQIKSLSEENYFNYYKRPHLYKPLGDGETIDELINRANSSINDIIANNKGKSILVVTHTMTLKAILCALSKKTAEFFWDSPFIKQTSLTEIDFLGDNHNIITLADASHHKYSFKEFNEEL